MTCNIVFVAAKRTPFGAFGGSLASLTATDLAVIAAEAALKSSGVDARQIDHVVFGNVLQTSADAPYLARHVGLRSGTPVECPAVTLNRLCGSGFEALAEASRLLQTGEAEVVLAGGAENMSQAPFVLRNARFGYRMNHGALEDSLVSGLTDSYAQMAMSGTAELIAEENGITRDACDRFSLRSHQRAHQAAEAGYFEKEIAPVPVTRKRESVHVLRDEHMRADASLEALSKLRPVFKKDGMITAGNASGICDGAAALILTTRARAEKECWPVLGQLIGNAVVGVDPKRMGIGPVAATRKLLEKTGMSLAQMDLIEVNEAFAAQCLVVAKQLEIPEEKLNIHGGAVALGHPLAASGARITAHVLYELSRQNQTHALVSACIGGGQGQALLIRRA
ncbi:MAG: acetyl-CoA C-acetyltransferase [Bdellovibrionales bacterium]|nr:acetyl-CoA C-acetyltransferase [Bdellovibrionales bacterium]